jgi:hypothetical protein
VKTDKTSKNSGNYTFLICFLTAERRAQFRRLENKKTVAPLCLPVLPVFTALSGWLQS